MSWRGFTKAISRLPHMVVRATGNADETKDEQFDELEVHFKLLESLIIKLIDDLKKYKDAIYEFISLQEEMGKDLQSSMELSLKPEDADKYIKYSDQMGKLKDHISSSITLVDKNFSSPLAKLLPVFQAVKDRMKKRTHKIIDFDRHRASMKKLKDEPSKNADLEKKIFALEPVYLAAEAEYQRINEELKKELPRFMDLVDFFNMLEKNINIISKGSLASLSARDSDMQKAFATKTLESLSILKRREPDTESPKVSNLSSTAISPSQTPVPQVQSVPKVPPSIPKSTKPDVQYVIALYDFDPIEPGDLQFRKDDRIELIQKDGDWWVGRVNGKTGNFPMNYVSQ